MLKCLVHCSPGSLRCPWILRNEIRIYIFKHLCPLYFPTYLSCTGPGSRAKILECCCLKEVSSSGWRKWSQRRKKADKLNFMVLFIKPWPQNWLVSFMDLSYRRVWGHPLVHTHTVVILLRAALRTTAAATSKRPSLHQQRPCSSTLPMKYKLLILASWIFHDLCQPGLALVFHPTLLLPSFEWQTVPLANSQAHIGHLYLSSSCCICLKYSPHSLLVKCLLVFKCFRLHGTLKTTLPQPALFLLITFNT